MCRGIAACRAGDDGGSGLSDNKANPALFVLSRTARDLREPNIDALHFFSTGNSSRRCSSYLRLFLRKLLNDILRE